MNMSPPRPRSKFIEMKSIYDDFEAFNIHKI